MSTIVEFTLPADSFPLGIPPNPSNMRVELERVVPTGSGIVPYYWVDETDADRIEAEFRKHPDITSVSLVDEVTGSSLFRAEWAPDYQGILRAITESEVVLISAVGRGTEWTFEVRAEEREQISRLQEYCLDNEVPITINSIRSYSGDIVESPVDLSEKQREAVVLAYQRGYFRSPRQTTLEELAREIGISGQAFGARLRRGIEHLIEESLFPPEE